MLTRILILDTVIKKTILLPFLFTIKTTNTYKKNEINVNLHQTKFPSKILSKCKKKWGNLEKKICEPFLLLLNKNCLNGKSILPSYYLRFKF